MKLILGDCLDKLKELDDNSIDCILTDPPYGTTDCSWDSVIPFEPMWVQLKRVIKPNGAIILFGNQPFTSALIMSNVKMYRHSWIWNKDITGSPQNRHIRPLPITEDIIVFGLNKVNYYPIMGIKENHKRRPPPKKYPCNVYKGFDSAKLDMDHNDSNEKYPTNIIKISRRGKELNPLAGRLHPTQKPVDLLKYLIKTYTQKGELVLDFTMGSGSTGVACLDTERDFIGIELDETYFNVAQKRINDHIKKGIEVELF